MARVADIVNEDERVTLGWIICNAVNCDLDEADMTAGAELMALQIDSDTQSRIGAEASAEAQRGLLNLLGCGQEACEW